MRSQMLGLTLKLCNLKKLVIRYKNNCPELLQLWLGPLSRGKLHFSWSCDEPLSHKQT